MITSEIRDQIRSRLLAKIERSTKKIDRMEDMTQPIGPENAIGRVSRMDAINNKSVMEAALRNAKSELDSLKKALHHLDDEDFGHCSRCGKAIEVKRLIYMPGSEHCVHCA